VESKSCVVAIAHENNCSNGLMRQQSGEDLLTRDIAQHEKQELTLEAGTAGKRNLQNC
jgi:hypothetical protein